MSRQLCYDEVIDGGRSIRDAHGRIRPRPGLAMDAAPRRRARDEEPGDAFTAEELLDDLHTDVRDLPVGEHQALLDGLAELVDGGSVEQWAAEDRYHRSAEDRRRGTRNRRAARDDPPRFEGRSTVGGAPVGLPPDRGGEDRRRRLAADAAGKLPTREELWPSTKSKDGLPSFEELFPGARRG
jgi:hypothetical protein